MTGEGALSKANHLMELKEENCERKKKWDDTNESTIKELVGDLIDNKPRLFLRAKNTGAWMNVWYIIFGYIIS